MHSATSVQVEGQGGEILEFLTQEAVEETIFSKVHNKQYTLAREAPICNDELFRDFGYTANMPVSKAVLDGTYVVPPHSDSATYDLFVKIVVIPSMVPNDSVSITITSLQWKHYWKIVKKKTLSSELARIA
jgi:hypothetical protein